MPELDDDEEGEEDMDEGSDEEDPAESLAKMSKLTKGDNKQSDKKENIDKALKAANKNTFKNSMELNSDDDEEMEEE